MITQHAYLISGALQGFDKHNNTKHYDSNFHVQIQALRDRGTLKVIPQQCRLINTTNKLELIAFPLRHLHLHRRIQT